MTSNSNNTGNRPELSVSELSRNIKGTLEQQFGRIKVRGEINSLAKPSSGHLYFSLVDPIDNTRIQAACWKGAASKLTMKPEDGQEVIVTARLTAYGARSQYQLIVDHIELAGIGALLKMLEERRIKLSKEGLFDPKHKRPLPILPRRIGVITSEKGAVWQDILHRVEDRFPLPVTLCPVLVQGNTAAIQVTAAIAAMNALQGDARPDVVIIARGGGSMEDLLPFHDEGIVRAVAASDIPIVSAIGHETDTTLIDYAADVRAPTPTAAAELVLPVRRELLRNVQNLTQQLIQRMQAKQENHQLRLARLRPFFERPDRLLETPRQQLDMASMRIQRSMRQNREQKQQNLNSLVLRLVSPREILLRQRTQLEHSFARLIRAQQNHHATAQLNVQHLSRRLIAPKSLWQQAQQRLTHSQKCLISATDNNLRARQNRLDGLHRLLEGTSLTRTLERGFALVLDDAGGVITSAKAAQKVQNFRLRFADGEHHTSTKE